MSSPRRVTGATPGNVVRALTRRVNNLSAGQLAQARASQAGYRSVEDGESVPFYDEDGNVRTVTGRQTDGSYTTVDYGGDVLEPPSTPIVEVQPGVLVITWDGFDAFGEQGWPANFASVLVHVSTDPDATLDSDTETHRFVTPDGGSYTYALPGDTLFYITLQTASSSGVKSPPSETVEAAVEGFPTDGVIDPTTDYYRQPLPPWPAGSPGHPAGTTWVDSDNGNLPHQWDGDSWEPALIGPEATTDDSIEGKVVPRGGITRLAWGVADPTPGTSGALTITSALASYPVPPPADGIDRTTAIAGTFRQSTGKWWLIQPAVGDARLAEIHTWQEGDSTRTLAATIGGAALTGYTGNFPEDWAIYVNGFVVRNSELSVWATLAGGSRVQVTSTSTWAQTRSFALTAGGGVSATRLVMGLDSDGSSLIFISRNSTLCYIIRHSATDGSWLQDVTLSETLVGTAFNTLGPPIAGDFGKGARFAVRDDLGRVVRVFSRTGTAQTAEHLASLPVATPLMLAYDASGLVLPSHVESAWKRTINGAPATSQAVRLAYTLADTTGALAETALSPAQAYTVPAGQTVTISGPQIPKGDENQPDCIYVYASVGSGPFTRQHPRLNPAGNDRVTPSANATQVPPTEFLPPFTTTGPVGPAFSTFPQGGSGEWQADEGGFFVRGDSVGAWPYFQTMLTRIFDSRFAFAAHVHPTLARIFDLNVEIAARANADEALGDRIDAMGSKYGTDAIAIGSINVTYSKRVDFTDKFGAPAPFPAGTVPVVFLTSIGPNPERISVISYSGADNAGFTAYVRRNTGTPDTAFSWEAKPQL